MPARKTKAENEEATPVLTRKSRKMVSARIVEERNAGLANEDQVMVDGETDGAQGKSAPRRPRKRLPNRKGGKGKVMRIDSVEGLNERYRKVLKDTFSELSEDCPPSMCTFDVNCEITVPAPGHILINATLSKGDYFLYGIARYSMEYPTTIMEVACDLYDFMHFEGQKVAGNLGA